MIDENTWVKLFNEWRYMRQLEEDNLIRIIKKALSGE